jgi:putative FmdB family regulatory protein
MPTYEYRCPEGHEFEQFVRKMSDAATTVPCPTCGLVGARKMSAGGGLVFKGSGFYITDYGKDGKKPQPTAAPVAAAAPSESASTTPAASPATPVVKPAAPSTPSTPSTPSAGPEK